MPILRSSATAFGEVGLMASSIASTAMASDVSANHTTVLAADSHSPACRSISGEILTRASRSILRFPAMNVLPSAVPRIPRPGTASNEAGLPAGSASSAGTGHSGRSFSRYSTTAPASGCSDFFSRARRIRRYSSCFPGAAHMNPVTRGFPSVSVPVLSRTTTSIFFATSRLSASLIRMPFSAPLPVPTMIAVGVASPRAHGQAIISTVIMARSPCVSPSCGANTAQPMNVITEMAMMTGTKTEAILSTVFCTGAFVPCASCTMCMIRESTVSVPTFSAAMRKAPFWFTVPA